MHRIKSFSVLRTSTTIGISMFLFVLALFLSVGLIGLLLSVFPHTATHQHAALHPAPDPLGPWFFALMPFAEGAMGFLFTALFCWVYNHIVGFTGGIELNVVKLSEALAPSSRETNS
jgi:hypothetical protein